MPSTARTFVARAPLLVVISVIALALSQIGDANAQVLEGGLAVDCEGNTTQIETNCQFGSGQEFTVSVHVTETPDGEYGGVQVKLRWDPALLDYLPTGAPAAEVAWQDCALPLRRDNRPDDPSVLFGCLEFTGMMDEPLRFTTFTGPALVFHMRCVNDGTTELVLVPFEGDPQFGSHLASTIGFPLISSLDLATVTCGGAPVVRPAPEVTVGVESIMPDETPAGTQDEDGDAETPAEDGSPPPDGAATSIGEPQNGAAEDPDGGVPVWGWILIGLGGLGAAGAASAVVWLRLRARA